MKFRLNDDYVIDAADKPFSTEGFRACLTGTSGSGKSYTAALSSSSGWTSAESW